MSETFSAEGGCSCGQVRYRVTERPLFVNCCHCTWCQRQSGSAFAINAMIESDQIKLLAGTPEGIEVPTPSGKGQTIMRCPNCKIAVWGHYGGAGDNLAFLRVGSLDDATVLEPDVHIYTSTKQPWVTLPEGKPSFPEYYSAKKIWPPESLQRMAALMG